MAKFPIELARQTLGFSPATAVRANIDTRQGDAGAAVGQALVAGAEIVQKESARKEAIRVKNRQNLDTLSAKQATELRKQRDGDIEKMKRITQPDKWEEETLKIATTFNDQITGLDFSPDELAKQQITMKSDLELVPEESFIDASDVISKATIQTAKDSLTEAWRVGDKDIASKELDFVEVMETNGVAASQILLDLKAGEKAGEVLRNKDTVERLSSAAVLAPEAMSAGVTKELEDRKTGEGSDQFASLTNSDLESLRDYSNTVGDKQKTESETNRNVATVDAYSRIRDGATDLDKLIDDNNTDPLQSDEDKIVFAEKIPSYFNKINSTVAAEASDADTYDALTQASEKVERGAMPPVEFEELYADNKHKLTVTDQRGIREKDIVATRTMQNRSFTDAMSAERPTFVAATEDEISSIKLARINAEAISDIPSLNLFNIALEKNRAQQWNYGRFRQQLRSQINQNPDWSAEQIAVAQDILVDQLDVTDDVLLREFADQNPRRAITNTPPDAQFKDIWGKLSLEDKSLIWAERMAGTPVEVLLESDNVQEAE